MMVIKIASIEFHPCPAMWVANGGFYLGLRSCNIVLKELPEGPGVQGGLMVAPRL